MFVVFALIPLLGIIAATFLYRHNGKRDFLFFDAVQFFYCFILTPVLFIWLKTFLFFLLRSELDLRLSVTELFIADSVFSVFGLFVYAFVVVHSLTKSFNLKRHDDPLYDLFLHSEYLHLWISHLVMYIGSMILLTVFALVNVFFPMELNIARYSFYALLIVGVVFGIFSYMMIWLSDPKQGNFMRVMKLSIGIFFIIHVLVYFSLDPRFNANYSMYWVSLLIFAAMVVSALLFQRSEKVTNWYDRLKDSKWGINVDLFK